MNLRSIIVTAAVAALLSGCGSAVSPLTPVQQDSAQNEGARGDARTHAKETGHRKEALSVHIRVPRRHRHRGPRYVSAGTQGITLAFTGPTNLDQTLGVTPSNDQRCTGPAGGPYTCNFTVQLQPGSYTASISTYDAVSCGGSACTIPGGAHLLSTAQNVPFAMKVASANHLGFTLDGVVAALSVSGLPSGTAGTAFGAPKGFAVVAKDADGYTIVGAYQSPVAIGDGDSTGATTLATSGSGPTGVLLSSSDTATLMYTGLAILPAAISAITATAGVTVSGSGTFAPTLQPIVVATSDALNPSFIGVDLYATSGTGSSGSLTISEAGWTNSPYNKSLVATPGSGCTTIGSVNQSGTTFTANVANAPSPGSCAVAIADGVGQSQPVTLAYTNFSYTGAAQAVTLPSGVTATTITALGAAGGGFSGAGGFGASVSATLGVFAGETLYVYVGGAGNSTGFNGGTSLGGGASDVRTSNTAALTGDPSSDPRIIVAGGGGSGGGGDSNGGNGGAVGGNGGNGSSGGSGLGGGGGTQNAGGAAGSSACDPGTPGYAGIGGYSDNGGGGGGWFGGGGGGLDYYAPDHYCDNGGAGGGGSSFVESGALNVTSTAGGNSNNNGQVTIVW